MRNRLPVLNMGKQLLKKIKTIKKLVENTSLVFLERVHCVCAAAGNARESDPFYSHPSESRRTRRRDSVHRG
ncbi:hypothetical protein J6590_006684 [Homalodisca vitripennis]|nr:hypothetical protein J6590_006684 [Homalodisca vitripennis]